jgi:uncharacterized protein with FMN-binding domain
MAKKVPRKLVALYSSVILAVYVGGYNLIQQPAGLQGQSSAISCTPSIAPTETPATGLPNALYRDGTYCGIGTSPFGDVQVAVKILQGRIRSVEITQITTYFPKTWIEGLPSQVVARQNATIDLVTGATGSSDAFQGAVSEALSKAHLS